MYKINIVAATLKGFVNDFINEAFDDIKSLTDIETLSNETEQILAIIKKDVYVKIQNSFEYSDIGIIDKIIMEKQCNEIFDDPINCSLLSGYFTFETKNVTEMLDNVETLNSLPSEDGINFLKNSNFQNLGHEERMRLIHEARDMI